VALKDTVVLTDTNVIIEAVRTRCWNALAGGLRLETVEECREEALRQPRDRPGYVRVSEHDVSRLSAVHPVNDLDRALFGLEYAPAVGMDPGERDLFAHAFARSVAGDAVWILCSPDKASVRAAVALGWHDRMHSLASIASAVGARTCTPLADHFGERWLSDFRTACLLGR
jgi:hypothetical protein